MAKITDKITQSSWPRVILVNVRINGNSAKVYTSAGLFETQNITLQKAGQPDINLIVSNILDERYIILRSGKQVALEDFSAYDDCTLIAPEQVRPPIETNPQWRGFQEFPTMAYRDLQVSHHGNPLTAQAGVLDIEDIEVRLIYNDAFQIQEIREFEKHPHQFYKKQFQVDINTSSLIFTDPLLPFMTEIGNQVLYYEKQDGSISNPAVYTITGFSGQTVQVSPQPTVNRNSLYSILDGRLGNRLKSTKFDGVITVERISPSEYESVTLTDIIGDVGLET